MINFEEKNCAVVKRNGMFVPFNRDRIIKALEAACRDSRSLQDQDPLPIDLETSITNITHNVVKQVIQKMSEGQVVTVERVQDIVESQLYVSGLQDIARDYIIYRENRKQRRKGAWAGIHVSRRDGSKVNFNPMKISSALEAAFRDTWKVEGITPQDLVLTVNELTNKVVEGICADSGGEIGIEEIQDLVEKCLMEHSHYDVAKKYILYREFRSRIRDSVEDSSHENQESKEEFYDIIRGDGSSYKLTKNMLFKKLQFFCQRYSTVNPQELTDLAFANFYSGMKEKEVHAACIMAARSSIEREPDYTYVASAMLLNEVYKEALGIELDDQDLESKNRKHFKDYISNGDQYRLTPRLKEYDLDRLASALNIQEDYRFAYMGMQNLYDRYFNKHEGLCIETPQIFWMRVAMGLALNEPGDKTAIVLEFYYMLSTFRYVPATPTLFNSGTKHSQLSSCYLSTISDDLSHIFKVISDNAQLSKWAGGLGNDWTSVRATGALIKGTSGKSQGIIPFIKVSNDTAIAVNQGGKRKGALCAYLEIWHLDYEEFLELRKNTGDERRRTHDINTASWIPDLFFKRLLSKGYWTFFSPDEVPGLHESYGQEFENLYQEYERKAESGEINLWKRVEAETLWRKMLSMVYETGHPWLTFKDPSNIRSAQDHVGVVRSSNLCTEIILNSSEEETAVCNLGSVNLIEHIVDGRLDEDRLRETVSLAVRMLDNVIDLNFYPTQEAANANYKHRAIGLGMMGFQDALYSMDISYASQEAVEFADESMEMISYYAILASASLAKERGQYASYKGSKWDKGLLPIDTLALLQESRGYENIVVSTSCKKDWTLVREAVSKYGMRNCQLMAIAPTATISNIIGVTQSVEPTYKHLFVKSNISGEFTVPNIYLIKKLKQLGLWDTEMLDDLKYFDGSLEEIERVPDAVKQVYLTAFEIDSDWIISCCSRRQKWIDMGHSLNLYLAEPDGKKLSSMYLNAWQQGLKTTYYLRSTGATSVEKSSIDLNKRGIQPRWMKNKSASTNIVVERVKKPSVCSMEDGCEACQ